MVVHMASWRAAVLALGLAFPTGAQAAPTFKVVDLGSLAAGSVLNEVRDINAAGHVVGRSNAKFGNDFIAHPYIWTPDGGLRDLFPYPSGSYELGNALAINDHDVVLGYATDIQAGSVYWLWQNGHFQALPGGYSWADINNAGQVVGSYTTGASAAPYLAIRQPDGTIERTGVGGVPKRINETGRVSLGSASWGWWSAADGVHNLPPPIVGGAQNDQGINASGQLAGTSGSKPFLWTPGIGFTPLADVVGYAHDVNDSGWVVGNLGGTGAHTAALWMTPGGDTLDLEALIDPSDPLKGHVDLIDGWAVNASGQIATRGRINTVAHAYLLTPVAAVPEPAAAWMLGGGLLLLLVRRRRDRPLQGW